MAEKQKRPINLKLVILIAILAGVSLTVGTYLARGWIRGPLVSWYAERVYLPKIEQAFEQDFKEISPRLASLGFTFDEHYSAYLDKPAACHDARYEGFGLTKYCYKRYFNDNPGPEVTDAYRETWRTESPAFEQYMLANGWTKTWNAAQPIDELLIRDDGGASVGVNYEKRHGKITCKLSVWYNGSESEPTYRQFDASQACERTIKFFGGY